MAVDLIFFNGDVITMNNRAPKAEAFSITGGRFLLVGSNEEAREFADRHTESIDLKGRTVIPGFIESHNHLSWFGMSMKWPDCSWPLNKGIEDVKERIREGVESVKAGEWVIGKGYDDTMMVEKRHLTRYDIDEVAPRNPVFILHTSGHLSYANSMALEIAGIGQETPQPGGGEIHKDDNGVPTGLLKEASAQAQVGINIPRATVSELKDFVRDAVAHVHRFGITSVHDAAIGATGHGKELIQVYRELEAENELNLRVYMTILEGLYQHLFSLGLGTGFGSEYVKLGCVKLIQDGSIQGWTAALQESYYDKPDFKGELILSQEKLDELVEKYHRAGLQIAIHANGSAAIESVILAIERAQKTHPRKNHRHMIIHCQTATPDHISRMKRLGVVPSYFVNHTYYWGDRHYSIFLGPERASRISPLASSLKEGLLFSLHSDLPVTPVDPLFSMHCAVNRLTRDGMVLGPEERIPPVEALRAYTTSAAYCSFEEGIKGSIETNKLADFAVLSDNPLKVAPDTIKDIRVLRTVIGGKTVYESS